MTTTTTTFKVPPKRCLLLLLLLAFLIAFPLPLRRYVPSLCLCAAAAASCFSFLSFSVLFSCLVFVPVTGFLSACLPLTRSLSLLGGARVRCSCASVVTHVYVCVCVCGLFLGISSSFLFRFWRCCSAHTHVSSLAIPLFVVCNAAFFLYVARDG